mgnify:FL=1
MYILTNGVYSLLEKKVMEKGVIMMAIKLSAPTSRIYVPFHIISDPIPLRISPLRN